MTHTLQYYDSYYDSYLTIVIGKTLVKTLLSKFNYQMSTKTFSLGQTAVKYTLLTPNWRENTPINRGCKAKMSLPELSKDANEAIQNLDADVSNLLSSGRAEMS